MKNVPRVSEAGWFVDVISFSKRGEFDLVYCFREVGSKHLVFLMLNRYRLGLILGCENSYFLVFFCNSSLQSQQIPPVFTLKTPDAEGQWNQLMS